MEFREYGNPEERDYDIKSGLNDNYSSSSQNIQEVNKYSMQLFNLIGILEDFDETELIENYGITVQEYLRPTAETIQKVSEKLNSKQNGRSR
ncbi:MAG: hypothetical protein ACI31S_00555 [Bacilli bacterium]